MAATKKTNTKFLIGLFEEYGFVFDESNSLCRKELSDGFIVGGIISGITIQFSYYHKLSIPFDTSEISKQKTNGLTFVSRRFGKVGHLLLDNLDVIINRLKTEKDRTKLYATYQCYVFLEEEKNAIFSRQWNTSNGKSVEIDYFSTISGFVDVNENE